MSPMHAAPDENPRALVTRWFEEVWNQGRADLIDQLLAPDVVADGLGGSGHTSRGPDPFKAFYTNLRSAIPDLHITIENMLSDGNDVAVRISCTGTHSGDGLGVAPTEKQVHVEAMVILRVDNGKLIQGWNLIDMLSLLTQIGAIHDPVGPTRLFAARS